MMSVAQQMLQDSRTKIELLRMQIIKVTQVRDGERESTHGKCYCTHVLALLSPPEHSREAH